MFNKVIMMGRITHDLELKTTPSGKSVCRFSIAVERRFKNADGERQTDFFNVSVWNKTAEMVTTYFSKGNMILVEGEMTTRKYTDKDGKPAIWYEIVADCVSFTGEKRDCGEPSAAALPSYGAAQTPQADFAADTADDDYPF